MAQTDLKKKTGAESQISTWGPTDLIKKLTDLKKKLERPGGFKNSPGAQFLFQVGWAWPLRREGSGVTF